jgi:hypothetical protein
MGSSDLPARGVFDRFQARLTRRGVLKSAGVSGLGALAAYTGYIKTRAQQSPEVQAALDVAITLESLAVTMMGVARDRGQRLGLSAGDVRFIRAAQCEEEAHYHFFESAGGTPSTTTFSIANATFADRQTFYQRLSEIEALSVGTYMAATRLFAQLGDLRLVEVGYQIGAVEGQHLALARSYGGNRLPNDRAFAEWMFNSVDEAGQALIDAGYIDGGGKKYDYPGPVDIFCRGVFGLVPEVTEEEAVTPAASPSPAASPAASPQSTPEA